MEKPTLILKKQKGFYYIALKEKSADEVIIITPDLFWDLKGGFLEIVANNIFSGKKYIYIVWSKFKNRAYNFFYKLKEMLNTKGCSKGSLEIYIVEFPIVFEIAIYIDYKSNSKDYVVVIEREYKSDGSIIAWDLILESKDYKHYINTIIQLAKKNYVDKLIL